MTSIKSIRDLVSYWQRGSEQGGLGLQDWRIQTAWYREKERESPLLELDEVAAILWWPESRFAKLRIRRRRDLEDYEDDVLHELCHLRLEGHKPCVHGRDPQYEWGLNAIVEALLAKEDRR